MTKEKLKMSQEFNQTNKKQLDAAKKKIEERDQMLSLM
jgi:hypothetical protein